MTSRSNMAQPGRDRVLPTTARTSRSENIKKVAITMKGVQAQLLELDQNRPLAAIIQDVCHAWNLGDPDTYALQFSEPNRQKYITERSRSEIQNGNVLQLKESPAKTAENLYKLIDQQTGSAEERIRGLTELSKLSADATFATEFIAIKGSNLLINIVKSGKYKGEPLSYTLKSFVALMDHSIISWDVLDAEFIKKVAECVNYKSSQDNSCLQSALVILELVVLNSTDKLPVVEQVVTPTIITPYLEKHDLDIQKSALALINALFMKADPEKKKKIAENLQSRTVRNTILSVVGSTGNQMGQEMAHQLYLLQAMMLNLHEDKYFTAVDPHNQKVLQDIEELRRIAFDVEGDPNINTVRKSQSPAQDYRKLGFYNVSHPARDFATTPPGSLALHNMLYFARTHGESYVKVVLENSSRADEHDCPFVKASITLTLKICEILHIGDTPTEEGNRFYPMFFHHDKPFEEFFSIVIQLLNKTWREMKATAKDFEKVLGVVKEQVIRALEIHPATFDAFKNRLNQLSYAEIMKLWELERQSKEEWSSQAKPIIELREKLKPEILELIKQQRLNVLEEGTRFNKYTAKARMKDTMKKRQSYDKYWYWRLAPNHKAFHYGVCSESDSPPLEQLHNKLPIMDIKGLQVGKDCTHVKENRPRKGTNASDSAFSIIPDTSESYNFVASSELEFDHWTDGINALLGNPMTSRKTEADLETLLSMEIKLRLLDTEGITIPKNPPPMPKEPSNYNFIYNL
ncbi:engulfment and cell motility protein 1 isoform X2 [Patella vulgata]|uniref:engulfment and cell motility protein 1 isoform X2 n=1 Tax=Patella vulgata TaxID=6465 RepID=UPI0024A97E2F|nr:engulfment and cell motility protein 1 isoform X2 [Patella vulgata]